MGAIRNRQTRVRRDIEFRHKSIKTKDTTQKTNTKLSYIDPTIIKTPVVLLILNSDR